MVPESWGLKDLGKDGLGAKIQEEKEREEEVVLMIKMRDIFESILCSRD